MHEVHAPALIRFYRYGKWYGFGSLNTALRFDSKIQFKLTVDAIHILMVVWQSQHVTQT